MTALRLKLLTRRSLSLMRHTRTMGVRSCPSQLWTSKKKVCVAWPVRGLPSGKVCLHPHTQRLLGVKVGQAVKAQPLRGAILPAHTVRLLCKAEDEYLWSADFLEYVLHTYEGKVLLPGSLLSFTFYGRPVELKVFSVSGLEPKLCLAPREPDQAFGEMIEKLAAMNVQNLPICSFTDELAGDEKSNCSQTFYQINANTVLEMMPRGKRSDKKGTATEDNPDYQNKVTYESVGGLETQLAEIRELIHLPLARPDLYHIYGLEAPRGVLLHGPPGTGKTLLARAIAAETKARFFVINGPEVMSKFYGESEARLRRVFEEASESCPAIIFIDELDAMCPKRDGLQGEVEKRIVATLLTLMDGIGSESTLGQLIVLAATNRPQAVDSALRRPGRFDREIEVGVPGPTGRMDILQRLLRRVSTSLGECDLQHIASCTHGYVGADLSALCREAGLNALRQKLNSSKEQKDDIIITMEDFKQALKVVRPSAMREVALDIPPVAWSDVGGQEEVKLKLQQTVQWPRCYPEAFKRMGIRPPRGVLLYGPPGCSKTLMARALATESGLNFISIKAGELLSKWVGESERAVREVFRKARAVSPSILFFDELDALAGERASDGGSSGVADRVLAQLLTEMDGIEPLRDVTILAATNRPDLIDKALLRPGRIDRILYVPLPVLGARLEILRVHCRSIPTSQDVSLDHLAEITDGYSSAELASLCREAALLALTEDIEARSVTMHHFEQALLLVRPCVSTELLDLYKKYQKDCGVLAS
uniref:ATPase family gene 2 protein homolog A isoform X2 n=1 Tax=Myxine glutinosa TaxID=7769 RepID=UPI00358EF08A